MEPAAKAVQRDSRIARHRRKLAIGASKRVEVTVPADDANLVKSIAGMLRAGGNEAKRIRDTLEPMLTVPKATTGRELVAFFRASPLVGVELQIERDRSAARDVDLD